MQLHDRHDARRVGRMHDVAGVDEAKARFSRERRTDCRIADLRLGVVDRRLVALDLRDELIDRRLLRVELLARNRVLLGEGGIALQVELRVLQIRLVLRLLRERLIERRLIGPRIDLHEKIAFLDHLALFEGDLDDLAVDAAAHSHRVVRLHGAESVQIDREVCRLHLRNCHGDGREVVAPVSLSRHCCPGSGFVNIDPAQIAAKDDCY